MYDLLIYPPSSNPFFLTGFSSEESALLEAHQLVGERLGAVIITVKRPGFIHAYTVLGGGKLVVGIRRVSKVVKVGGEEVTLATLEDRRLPGSLRLRVA